MKHIFLLTQLIFYMATNSFSQTEEKTYILVHGAGHGSWCWTRVIPLLEAYKYRAIAPDLPSKGDDVNELAGIGLYDDVKKVTDEANAVEGKVILVGHSSGGIIIAQAAEMLGPEKVDKLIFLDAFMPKNAESVFTLADKIRESNKANSNTKNDAPTGDLFIFSEDAKSAKWNPEIVKNNFYHDCSPEDIEFAKAQLRWQSLAVLATPVHLTDGNYGRIKKYYILCTEAKDLDKSSVISNVSCEKVYKLASSHSPFFSMPQTLTGILRELY